MRNDKTPVGDTVPTAEDSELTELGVAAAAAAIRSGEITAESYSAALLRQARKHAELNSFITIDESAVLAAAAAADKARAAGHSAPVLGVPLGVKDSYLTRGLRTTFGVEVLEGFTPTEDAEVIAAIKAAGGIVFGKNNLVEMSFGLTGDNTRYGQVKNPYDTDRVSGGSSSGSAASVAARIVPAAFGGDTVGSIRVPASLVGVVGFKPTTGRWSGDGVAPISHTLDTPGIFARTVEDCALIDQIVTKQAPPARSELDGARFAYAPKQYLGPIETETEAQFRNTLQRLQDAGADVVEIDLGEDFSVLAGRLTWNLFFRETMQALSEFLRRHDIPASFHDIYEGLKPELKDVWSELVLPSGPGFISQQTYEATLSVDRPELQRRFAEVFGRGGIDALLSPTTPSPAPLIEQQMTFTISGEEVDHLVLARNTVPASGAGLPGISVPMGTNRQGLPVGLEIDGAHGNDRKLLELAHRVEAALDDLPAPARMPSAR
jgi:Asp-tRNA(Asn)/Glu-tRNA(Gln) amidotransferase A subunit family amidase